jgi:hypothetical protein
MSRSRTGEPTRLLLGGLAILVVAGALAAISRRPELRVTLDATKTRAYSLSPQTRELLGRLEGDWRIAVVLASGDVDARLRRQVDEVLRRFRAVAPSLEVTSVDPSVPSSLAAYEALLARLQSMEDAAIARYERTLDEGSAVFDELLLYAEQISLELPAAAGFLPADDPRREGIAARAGFMTALARDGDQIVDEIDLARRPGDETPLPRYDIARSILREACSQSADEVLAIADIFDEFSRTPSLDAQLRLFARQSAGPARELATRLVVASEALLDLPDLQSARVAAQLSRGEAAVVLGPDRVAVIPSEELLPTLALDAGAGSATFDRRFQGEQVIAAAIRSLLVDVLPMAVVVHAEETPLLASRQDATDLVGLQRVLERSRIDVHEWQLGRMERPVPAPGQPVAWIVVPPLRRTDLTPGPREQTLIDTTERLLLAGESVLLSVNPSRLPQFRQSEPWTRLIQAAGVAVDPGRVLLEATPVSAGEFSVQAAISLDMFDGDHPLTRALDGQRLTLPVPIPLIAPEEADAGGAGGAAAAPAASVAPDRRPPETVIAVDPAPGRWLEADWGSGRLPTAPPPGAGLSGPTPLVVALDRPNPAGPTAGVAFPGRQRLLVVGSGGWMRSRTADAIADLGNGRVVLVSPGNHELGLAGVAWLTGQDDLVSASSAGGQVARLTGIDGPTRTRWALGAVVIAPALLVLVGTGAWWWRRRAT